MMMNHHDVFFLLDDFEGPLSPVIDYLKGEEVTQLLSTCPRLHGLKKSKQVQRSKKPELSFPSTTAFH